MSSRCGFIGARPGPISIAAPCALGPPVLGLDAVGEVDDAEAHRRLVRAERFRPRRRPSAAARAAATPSTAAPARRPRRAENAAATGCRLTCYRAHLHPSSTCSVRSCRRPRLSATRPALVLAATPVPELLAGDDPRRQIGERRDRRRPAVISLDQRLIGRQHRCVPARSPAASSRTSRAPASSWLSQIVEQAVDAGDLGLVGAASPLSSIGWPSA